MRAPLMSVMAGPGQNSSGNDAYVASTVLAWGLLLTLFEARTNGTPVLLELGRVVFHAAKLKSVALSYDVNEPRAPHAALWRLSRLGRAYAVPERKAVMRAKPFAAATA